jgi:hypothetical protein
MEIMFSTAYTLRLPKLISILFKKKIKDINKIALVPKDLRPHPKN